MAFDDIWRLGASANLAVASAAGAAVSTAVFGSQTYAVMVNFPGSTSSTHGVRIKIGTVGEAPVADTTSPLIFGCMNNVFKVTPGQRLSAISNDAGTPTLTIVQLTK